MAKNKYELLAENFKKFLEKIDLFFEQVSGLLAQTHKNSYFYVGFIKSHIAYMRLYAPSIQLRKAWNNLHYSNVSSGPFILSSIKHGKENALLCCVDDTEHFIPWELFKKEEQANSLINQWQTAKKALDRENTANAIILKNLSKTALPFFQKVIQEWKDDIEGHDTIPTNPEIIYQKSFAPKECENLAIAYEMVLKSLKYGSLRNYERLQNLWKKKLEELMFENTNLKKHEKKSFLKQWEMNFFRTIPKIKKSPNGRWPQAYSLDRITAAKIIRYFINRFVGNPQKHQIDGIIVCLLWTFIWFSINKCCGVLENDILFLKTDQLSEQESVLIHKNDKAEISSTLHKFLLILRGKGKGQRSCNLFPGLSPKRLQNGLKRASASVLGKNKLSISPSAFLSLPHSYPDLRMNSKYRDATGG